MDIKEKPLERLQRLTLAVERLPKIPEVCKTMDKRQQQFNFTH